MFAVSGIVLIFTILTMDFCIAEKDHNDWEVQWEVHAWERKTGEILISQDVCLCTFCLLLSCSGTTCLFDYILLVQVMVRLIALSYLVSLWLVSSPLCRKHVSFRRRYQTWKMKWRYLSSCNNGQFTELRLRDVQGLTNSGSFSCGLMPVLVLLDNISNRLNLATAETEHISKTQSLQEA